MAGEDDIAEKIHSVAREFVKEVDYDRKFFSYYNPAGGELIAEMGYESGDDAGNVVRAVHKLSEIFSYKPFCRYSKDLLEIGSAAYEERVSEIGKMSFIVYRWNEKDMEGKFSMMKDYLEKGYISELVKL